jgi:hypothetical protein
MWRSLIAMMGLWGGLALGVPVDVPAGHWARQALERVMQLGLLTGYPDGFFHGEQALTRYQAAVLANRLLQTIEYELDHGGHSPTLAALDPATLEALARASQELQQGLTGLEQRLETLETLVRASVLGQSHLTGTDPPPGSPQEMKEWVANQPQSAPSPNLPGSFGDIPAGHWARQAVITLAQQGLIQGYPAGRFEGERPLSRYEAAQLIYQVVQRLGGAVAPTPESYPVLQQALSELAGELRSLGVRVEALESHPMTIPLPPGLITEHGDPLAVADLVASIREAAETGYAAFMQGEALAVRLQNLTERLGPLEQTAQTLNTLSNLALALGVQVSQSLERLERTEQGVAQLGERLERQSAAQKTLEEQLSRQLRQQADQLRDLEKNRLEASLVAALDYRGAAAPQGNFDVDPLWGQGDQKNKADLASQQESYLGWRLSGAFSSGNLQIRRALAQLQWQPLDQTLQLPIFDLEGSLGSQSLRLEWQPQARFALASYLLDRQQQDTPTLRLEVANRSGVQLISYLGSQHSGLRLNFRGDLGQLGLAIAQEATGLGVALEGEVGGPNLYLRAAASQTESSPLATHLQTGFALPWARFAANYRSIPATAPGTAPYTPGQEGYGLEAVFKLNPLELGVFVDARPGVEQQAHGLSLGWQLGQGKLEGYYNQALRQNQPQYSLDRPDQAGYDPASGRWGSNLGLRVGYQDDQAQLGAGYRLSSSSPERWNRSDLEGYARFTLALGSLRLTPFARFHQYGDLAQSSSNYQNYKAGLTLEASRLLGPLGLEATLARRASQGTALAEESLLRVGLSLHDTPLPGQINLGYGWYQGGWPDLEQDLEEVLVDGLYDGIRYGPQSPTGQVRSLEGIYLSYRWETLRLLLARYWQTTEGQVQTGHQFQLRYRLQPEVNAP